MYGYVTIRLTDEGTLKSINFWLHSKHKKFQMCCYNMLLKRGKVSMTQNNIYIYIYIYIYIVNKDSEYPKNDSSMQGYLIQNITAK